MNRSEQKLYRKQVWLIRHDSLQRALEKAGIDPATVELPLPRPIRLNKRLTATQGLAGNELEISYKFWKQADGYEMRDLLKHEILHYLFLDNRWDGWGTNHDHCQKRWKRILWHWGVKDHTNYKYKHYCPKHDGRWVKNHRAREPRYLHCRRCDDVVKLKHKRMF